MTFDEATQHAAMQFHADCRRAIDPTAFDEAITWMRQMQFRANIKTGTTRNREGLQAQFVNYDWAQVYAEQPQHVYCDFFRGHLLNAVSRITRSLKP